MKSLAKLCLAGACLAAGTGVIARELPLPPRPASASPATEFLTQIAPLPFGEREAAIRSAILSGNVPAFLRKLRPVEVAWVSAGRTNHGVFYATPDYLAVGSDDDYFLAPMAPASAQMLADTLGCTLPTRRMVDAIYSAAEVELAPAPLPPSAAMTTVPVFSNHNFIVRSQRTDQLQEHPLGALVAGHKKDVVLSARLTNSPGKVAIYGWHKPGGSAIQPLYLGHTAAWVDYSQCVRLVQQRMQANGEPTTVSKVLASPDLAGLLSDEGPLDNPRYETNLVSAPPTASAPTNAPAGAVTETTETVTTNSFNERSASFFLQPEVRVLINSPAAPRPGQETLLILFALPNGNTIEQTMGKQPRLGDDWHFDIQHVAAQTRFLRQVLTNQSIVVAYLEAGQKSWPAWRKKHGDSLIPQIVDSVKKRTPGGVQQLALTSHSGGGSFIFGYLNATDQLPPEIVRIAFLDSNYAYDQRLGHDKKLAAWLRGGNGRVLCVLAYNDAVALLKGKTFVTESGGTWGRSRAMLDDWREVFTFSSRTNDDLRTVSALDGRLQFLLKENPERKIFHTVQVERNGFIHCLLASTPYENQGYTYFGARAYNSLIQPD